MNNGFFLEDETDSPAVRQDRDREILSHVGCKGCPLKRGIDSPQMEPYGDGKKGILLLGEAPGEDEDIEGRPFVGRSGGKLEWALGRVDIDMDKDCYRQNAIQCWPGKGNEYPGDGIADRCRPRLEKQIGELKPKVIVALGRPAMKALLFDDAPKKVQSQMKSVSGGMMTRMRGRIIPSRTWGCPVLVSLHPSWYLRNDKEEELLVDDMSLIWKAMEYYGKPMQDKIIDRGGLVTDFKRVKEFLLEAIINEKVSYDFETTSLNPYDKDNKILVVSVVAEYGSWNYTHPMVRCIPVDWPKIWTDEHRKEIKILLQKLIQSKSTKIVHNVQFEHQWGEQKLFADMKGDVWDTMVVAHVLDGRDRTTNLDFQVWQMTGDVYGQNLDKSNLLSHRLEDVAVYGCKDAYYAYMLKKEQEQALNEKGNEGLKKAAEFYQRGILPLSRMTMKGLGIDVEKGEQLLAEFSSEIEKIDKKIRDSEFTQKYEKKCGKKFNPNSGDHVGEVLFKICGIEAVKKTATGKKPSVDESALRMIAEKEKGDIGDFVSDILRGRKLKKTKGTYIEPILNKRDSSDILHPLYNLHIANSYRSSSENPNFQNIPVRDPDMARVREVFVPHIGQWYLEGDVKGLEIAMMAMYSKDRRLTECLVGGYDLHKEWAAKMYGKPVDEVTSEERDRTKSYFVFAEFYGDYWEQIAPNFPHRHPKFIEELEFELRREFKGVFAWRKKRVKEYKDKGYADNYLGFRRLAPMKRNELLNFPIQSTGFLLVLAGIVDMDDLITKKKMKSCMVAQGHDSVLFDEFEDEIDETIGAFSGFMGKRRFPWMGKIPLKVEWKIGRNWGQMEKI